MSDKTTNLNKTLLKSCFVLPLIWFAAYIGLVVIGGLAAMYGASDKFYCTVYCKIGVWILIAATGVYVAYQTAKYIRSCRSSEEA
jgi:hypothetical protein